MNILLIASVISILFLIAKMGMTYKNMDTKTCIQDAVLAFASSAIGLYGYEKYGSTTIAAKVTEVFTEKPNF